MRMIGTIHSAVLVSGIALALTACASTQSREASRVQLISQNQSARCQFIGRVEGSSTPTGMAREAGCHNALNSSAYSCARG